MQYFGVQVLAQATNDLHYGSPRDRASWPARHTRTAPHSTPWPVPDKGPATSPQLSWSLR
ncbi:MAG TPA: hypothetical protein VHN80_21235 [Kineosporiaceae bacterium]|nr:hypothetical protein [Kineosporiaceae bacterium]